MPFHEVSRMDERLEFVMSCLGGRSEPSRPVPAVRDRADDRLQVAVAMAARRCFRSGRSVAAAASFAEAKFCDDRGGGVVAARRASCLGWPQDRSAVDRSRRDRGACCLDSDGDPQAARGRAGRFGGGEAAFTRFERDAAERALADGLQGPCALAAGRLHPLTVLDDHSRFALVLAACADERTETSRSSSSPLSAAMACPSDDHRQRLALGRRPGQPVHPARRLADRAGHPHRPFPALSSPDNGQGRALPPQPQGRGAGRSAVCRSRRRCPGPRTLAQCLQHRAAARGARPRRAGQPLPAKSSRLYRDPEALRLCAPRHRPPRPARRTSSASTDAG